jgi:ribonuclease-3
MKDLVKLEKKIKIKFNGLDLLQQALVHRSYLNEHPEFKSDHNERLEFLGDAVLELVVTEYLYEKFPQEPEGKLTNLRASLVNAHHLAQKAKELKLNNYLYLSKGEAKESSNTKARENILANTFEALIGAIYLDSGYKIVKKFIERNLTKDLAKILTQGLYLDAKSKFQEIAQEKYALTPHYKVLSEVGPDHAKIFKVGVYIGPEFIASDQGLSKQEAQVNAAKSALKKKGWQ